MSSPPSSFSSPVSSTPHPPLSFLFLPHSPVRLLGGTTFRYMYCMIMGCWGANVIHDLFDQSLYFRSSNDLLDAFTYFGMPRSTLVCTSLHTYAQMLCIHEIDNFSVDIIQLTPISCHNCGCVHYTY